MRTVLAAAAMLGMTASAAFAACGHDMVKKETTGSVASVDMSTTASTSVDKTATEEVKPADAD